MPRARFLATRGELHQLGPLMIESATSQTRMSPIGSRRWRTAHADLYRREEIARERRLKQHVPDSTLYLRAFLRHLRPAVIWWNRLYGYQRATNSAIGRSRSTITSMS